MKKLHRVLYVNVVVVLTIIGVLTLLRRANAQQDDVGFLYPPYFGSSYVSAVFDHEYPMYWTEIDYPDDDNLIITSTIMHNDGISYTNNIPGYSGHDGIDYGLRYQYVLASHAGTVQKAGWDNSANHRLNLGLTVQLETTHNGQTYQTDYGHLSAIWVSQGEVDIAAGNLLGISGSTGKSTGPHLHFSVHNTDNPPKDMNPYGWNSNTDDPWSQLTTGDMDSHNLWADRDGIGETHDPPNISNSTVYSSGAVLAPTFTDPRLTPVLTATTTYILDDSDTGFSTIGTWQTPACAAVDCYEDDWHSTTISGTTAV